MSALAERAPLLLLAGPKGRSLIACVGSAIRLLVAVDMVLDDLANRAKSAGVLIPGFMERFMGASLLLRSE
jgi:hypothetical protein